MRRRDLLKALGASALLPAATLPLLEGRAWAASGRAERVIFFYYPDGVPGWSQEGDASRWHPQGSTFDFTLPQVAEPLAPFRERCVWFRGLSMGGTDAGSHPGGAKKLLTGKDGGQGESIDTWLSRTAGADSPWRHLHLGVMATQNNATGDKFITYVAPGQTVAPEDDPRAAFSRLFGTPGGAPVEGGGEVVASLDKSVIDGVLDEMNAFKQRLGGLEATKLDLHLDALRDLERQVSGGTTAGPALSASCDAPFLDTGGFGDHQLQDAAAFPAMSRAQIDLAVLAMACGKTRVATIQHSHHTSELIMSRFPDTDLHDPGFDMRSHQASHYGARHDDGKREFSDYVKQRRWFVEQFAYLLQRLDETPEGDGTMLDHSLVVLVTEVCDGNLHLHDDMPFLIAGGAGGRLSGGRLLDVGYRRHGDLWASVADAMGQPVSGWGDGSSGPIPGLLS